jgi:HlyD family type I secretion membrane fusion protein
VYTIGGVISASQPLMEIAPFGDALIVEVRVAPTDIDNISGGEATEVRFSAFKQRSTLTLLGSVVAVSVDSFTETDSHAMYYTARIRVADAQLALLGNDTLQAGMPAEVFIKTGSRTLLEYLWAPLADVLSRALKEE